MSERLQAMLALAQVRDGMVVQLFLTAAIVLVGYGLLRLSGGSRLVAILIDMQLGLVLWAWVVMLVVLAAAQ